MLEQRLWVADSNPPSNEGNGYIGVMSNLSSISSICDSIIITMSLLCPSVLINIPSFFYKIILQRDTPPVIHSDVYQCTVSEGLRLEAGVTSGGVGNIEVL